ncbi:NAD(P)/FAD-dependent oxidoreductase [Sphingobacterium deserti]|uniref:Alkyl hydroperoxide reductase, F52a subunit n=1 Tax=Sphingobacterium deserti TaxID=1229276 RepID=A0A0B8T3C6_9SPHI|nr:NAD(P)/FAD-dependent oxidoreductase [Sphingobacterium deserti]KGE16027.1 alkyl hydroperoxide reductase, F52a subunit [Sphingobacterium deserti]
MQHTEQGNILDVIIIGGSYAGLSAAMALGRSLRKVLIIDDGLPCNRQTPHSHNFLTQDGRPPAEISALGKERVLAYPSITWLDDRAVKAEPSTTGFTVKTKHGDVLRAKKIILATGIQDNLPSIPGFRDCWGITVIHCPYCHGYEFRNEPTAIFAQGERALHLASLVRNLTSQVTIVTSGASGFDSTQLAKLKRNDVILVEEELRSIIHQKGKIESLELNNGEHLAVTALYAAVPFTQMSDLHKQLGCEESDQGYIKVDNFQKTNVPGVYACGDNSAMMRSVANAVYTGNLTGAMVNKELVDEQF